MERNEEDQNPPNKGFSVVKPGIPWETRMVDHLLGTWVGIVATTQTLRHD